MNTISCMNSFKFAFGPPGDELTLAARAHIAACPECSKRYEAIKNQMLAPTEFSPEEGFHGLVIRFLTNSVQILQSTGECSYGNEREILNLLGETPEKQAGLEREAHEEPVIVFPYVQMQQEIDEGLQVTVRVNRTILGSNHLRVWISPTQPGTDFEAIEVCLYSSSQDTPVFEREPNQSGEIDLGSWDDDVYVLTIFREFEKLGDILVDIESE